MLILLTVSLKTITYLRGTFVNNIIPLDRNIAAHVTIAWSIVFWAIIHSCAHYFNFLKARTLDSPNNLSLSSGEGITGLILCIILFLMATSAIKTIKKKCHEIFYIVHTLALTFFGAID
jgi:NADPH oxidase